jgi:hypothetical protein
MSRFDSWTGGAGMLMHLSQLHSQILTADRQPAVVQLMCDRASANCCDISPILLDILYFANSVNVGVIFRPSE